MQETVAEEVADFCLFSSLYIGICSGGCGVSLRRREDSQEQL